MGSSLCNQCMTNKSDFEHQAYGRNEDSYVTVCRSGKRVFQQLANSESQKIDRQSINANVSKNTEETFDYLIKEMDFENNGSLTLDQWNGFWVYIYQSGEDTKIIERQLRKIPNGLVDFRFRKARPNRQAISHAIDRLKRDKVYKRYMSENEQ